MQLLLPPFSRHHCSLRMRPLFIRLAWHCDFLHSHTRQQAFKVLEQNWKSYFASIKDFKVNPHKYNGLPKPPKFKNMENRKMKLYLLIWLLDLKKIY